MRLLRFDNINAAIRYSLNAQPERWKLLSSGPTMLYVDEEVELYKSIRRDLFGNYQWVFVTPIGMIDLSVWTNRLIKKKIQRGEIKYDE